MHALKQEILRLLKEDEEFRYAVAGLIGMEEVLRRLDKHGEELVALRKDLNELREDLNELRKDMNKLREDMNKGFELLERHISALGARWGLMSEEAFRSALRGLLGKELGLRVERWIYNDLKGYVYGYSSIIEVDVALTDEKTILIEVSSHVRASDVLVLKRKAELYEIIVGKKPDRLLFVTPYADEGAKEACERHGVELYTKV